MRKMLGDALFEGTIAKAKWRLGKPVATTVAHICPTGGENAGFEPEGLREKATRRSYGYTGGRGLHAYARRVGKSAHSTPPNPAKRPPDGHMGTCERCLARISPTGGEIGTFHAAEPREKATRRAYGCMRSMPCTHIPDGWKNLNRCGLGKRRQVRRGRAPPLSHGDVMALSRDSTGGVRNAVRSRR